MADEKDAAVKYCRREVGDETPTKFCMRPVKHANALDWCDECRAERLPFWPAGDATMIANDGQESAITADQFEAAQ